MRDNPGVIAPPPLIPLAALLLGLLLDRLLPLNILAASLGMIPRLVAGGSLIAAGAALELMAGHTFSKAGTNIPPWKPALALARDGVYRIMRNPMYVGFGFIALGLAVALGSDWTFPLMIPAAVILHRGVVLREERYLERKFGEQYRAYLRAVPRYGVRWPSR
jgi:protein-S-isoprenylcysteine O-methyltransferase Ste14